MLVLGWVDFLVLAQRGSVVVAIRILVVEGR
jgi:hypothetical protein